LIYLWSANDGHKWRAIKTTAYLKTTTEGIEEGSSKPQGIARPSSCLG